MSIHQAPIFFKPDFSGDGIKEASRMLRDSFRVDELHSGEEVLVEGVLRVIYANLLDKDMLWEVTRKHLLNKQVQVLTLIVDGQDELTRLVEFIGSNVNPQRCEEGSLRYIFGGGKKKIPGTNAYWFENKIHRPRTLDEAQAHFNALFADDLSWGRIIGRR